MRIFDDIKQLFLEWRALRDASKGLPMIKEKNYISKEVRKEIEKDLLREYDKK